MLTNAILNRGRSKVTKDCKKVFSIMSAKWDTLGSKNVESLDAAIDKYVAQNM